MENEAMTSRNEGRFCPSCGVEQDHGGTYCSACGKPMSGAGPTGGRPRTLWIVAAAAVVLAVIGIGFAAIALTGRGPAPVEVAAVATTTTTVPVAPVPEMTTTTTVVEYDDAAIGVEFGDSVYKIKGTGCDTGVIGSGFAIDEDHIVTNRHVVAIDTTPMIETRDGERFPGRVIGWREDPDIAVIAVDRNLAEPLEWADTVDLTEGERMVALGYPMPDNDFSVTPGHIVSFISERGQHTAIRSDAALDYGNSGGPSLTPEGEVAGVVTYMDLNWEGFQFVPVVVTADEVRETVDWIIDNPAHPAVDCSAVPSPEEPAPVPTPPVVAAPPTTAAPTPPSYYYPADSFYTVILASIKASSASYQDAMNQAAQLAVDYGFTDYGLVPGVLRSDDFHTLKPGLWVIYIGAWSDKNEAKNVAQDFRNFGIDAYAKLVQR